MNKQILNSLFVEELRSIENRISKSVIDLRSLVIELEGEHFRLSHQNRVLKEQINKNKKHIGSIIGNYVMEKIGINIKNQISLNRAQTEGPDASLFNNIDIEEKSSSSLSAEDYLCGDKLRLEAERHKNETKEVLSTNELLRRNWGMHSETEKRDSFTKGVERYVVTIEHGSEDLFELRILFGMGNQAKVRFCRFGSECERDKFVKEVIRKIGLKSVYYNIIKKIVEEIEKTDTYGLHEVDIADLDPWE